MPKYNYTKDSGEQANQAKIKKRNMEENERVLQSKRTELA